MSTKARGKERRPGRAALWGNLICWALIIPLFGLGINDCVVNRRIEGLRSAFPDDWIRNTFEQCQRAAEEERAATDDHRRGRVMWLQCNELWARETGRRMTIMYEQISPETEKELRRRGFQPTAVKRTGAWYDGTIYVETIWGRCQARTPARWENPSILAHCPEDVESVVLVRYRPVEGKASGLEWRPLRVGHVFYTQECDVAVVHLPTLTCTARTQLALNWATLPQGGTEWNRKREYDRSKDKIERWAVSLPAEAKPTSALSAPSTSPR